MTTPPQQLPAEPERAAILVQRLADQIERLTRFDAAAITTQGTATLEVPIAGERRFLVEWRREVRSGAGDPPDGTVPVAGAGGLEAHLRALEAAARGGLASHLERWLAALPAPVEPPLWPGACWDGAAPGGYVERCGRCDGRGAVTCGACSGNGRVTCQQCGGRGLTTCYACHGSGQQSCGTCSGRGTWWETRERRVSNPADGSSYTEYDQITHACMYCRGSGKLACGTCNRTGQVTCHACGGARQVVCRGCGGGGTVRCQTCEGAGRVYTAGRLVCDVREELRLEVHTAHPEAQALLSRLASLPEVAALAPLRRVAAAARGAEVTLRYAATVTVTQVQLEVRGHPLELLGYGPEVRTADQKNVVGLLLEEDLAALERVLAVRWWRARPVAALAEALELALESEVHSMIAAARGPAALAQLAGQTLGGVISAAYATRAAAALGRAARRLARPRGLLAMATGPLVAAGIAAGAELLGANGEGRLLAHLGAFAAGLLGALGLEQLLLARLLRRFRAEARARVKGLVRSTRALRPARVAAAALCAVAAAGSLVATGGVWVDARARQLRAAQAEARRAALELERAREVQAAQFRERDAQAKAERVRAAHAAAPALKPAARTYLAACLADAGARARVARLAFRWYCSVTNDPRAAGRFAALRESADVLKVHVEDGVTHWVLIRSCVEAGVPTGAFRPDDWWSVVRPIFHEDDRPGRTTVLNLLDVEGEQGGSAAEEARRLGEVIPPLLRAVDTTAR